MKYYAVTEDPNELFHYGVKGMKWGQHIFGDKPRSAGYRKALGKLRSSVKAGAKKVKSAAKKTSTQMAFNRRQAQSKKYEKAVLKNQQRHALVEGLYNLDRENVARKVLSRAAKAEAKANKFEMKRAAVQQKNFAKEAKKELKAEKRFDKYMQQAREGTLKYGKLGESQVQRITERLKAENAARILGSKEKPSYRKRLREAIKEGTLEGVTKGIAAGMTEIAKAKVQNRLMNRRVLDKKNRIEAKRKHESKQIEANKSRSEIREEMKDSLYKSQLGEGVGLLQRRPKSIAAMKKTIAEAKIRNDNNAKLYSAKLKVQQEKEQHKKLEQQQKKAEQQQKKLEQDQQRKLEQHQKKEERQLENEIYKLEKAERRRMAKGNAAALRATTKELNKEARIARWNAQYDRQVARSENKQLSTIVKKRRKAANAMKNGRTRATVVSRRPYNYGADLNDLFNNLR